MPQRYGIVSPPAIGHLNPMVALGLELQRRGHGVVVSTEKRSPAPPLRRPRTA